MHHITYIISKAHKIGAVKVWHYIVSKMKIVYKAVLVVAYYIAYFNSFTADNFI